jgi:hypothetical protein
MGEAKRRRDALARGGVIIPPGTVINSTTPGEKYVVPPDTDSMKSVGLQLRLGERYRAAGISTERTMQFLGRLGKVKDGTTTVRMRGWDEQLVVVANLEAGTVAVGFRSDFDEAPIEDTEPAELGKTVEMGLAKMTVAINTDKVCITFGGGPAADADAMKAALCSRLGVEPPPPNHLLRLTMSKDELLPVAQWINTQYPTIGFTPSAQQQPFDEA